MRREAQVNFRVCELLALRNDGGLHLLHGDGLVGLLLGFVAGDADARQLARHLVIARDGAALVDTETLARVLEEPLGEVEALDGAHRLAAAALAALFNSTAIGPPEVAREVGTATRRYARAIFLWDCLEIAIHVVRGRCLAIHIHRDAVQTEEVQGHDDHRECNPVSYLFDYWYRVDLTFRRYGG